MDIYDVIKTQVIDAMTPVITLTSIEVVSATSWKLYSCNTEWLTVKMPITIGGNSYTITSFVQDEYIIVSGTITPVLLSFQLSAPYFEYGTHRKVNQERSIAANKKLITPFVYMPFVENKGVKKTYDSPYMFDGDIRLFCLHEFDTTKPTRVVHNTNVIQPMKAMAKYLLAIIDQRQDLFDDVIGTTELERMDFGALTISGSRDRIFDEELSGVETSFELKVYENEITCGCCDNSMPTNCAPANLEINGVYADQATSGLTYNLILRDTDGNAPAYTFNQPTKTLTVTAAGGSFTYDLFNNGVDTGTDITVDGTDITINSYIG